jgi:hypothetical protein
MPYPIKIKYWKKTKYRITKSQENKDKANKQGNKNTKYICTNPPSQNKYINKWKNKTKKKCKWYTTKQNITRNEKEPMKENVKSKRTQNCIPVENNRFTFQEIKIFILYNIIEI